MSETPGGVGGVGGWKRGAGYSPEDTPKLVAPDRPGRVFGWNLCMLYGRCVCKITAFKHSTCFWSSVIPTGDHLFICSIFRDWKGEQQTFLRTIHKLCCS